MFTSHGRPIAVTVAALLASIGGAVADDDDPTDTDQSKELPSYMVAIEPDAAEAYWAPDSYHLIAQTRDPIALKNESGGMGALTYIFTIDGKEIWRVNDHGQDACSYFFPDGKRIVWTSTRDNMDVPVGNWSDSDNYPQGGELYSSNLDGTDIKRLTNNPYYEAEVSVSPNGEWIAFGRQIDGKMDIWIMRSDGTDESQVTHTGDWQEGAPFWMQDNEHIIFRAWRRSEYKKIRPTPMTVFTIKKDGTDWRRHTYDGGMNWHPHPTPDGHHYVYVKGLSTKNWEIYLGDLATGEHKRLTYYGNFDGLAAVSPDGKKMNWGRAVGPGFMQGTRTFIMDVSSLNLGPENFVPFDTSWGQPMQDDPAPAQPGN